MRKVWKSILVSSIYVCIYIFTNKSTFQQFLDLNNFFPSLYKIFAIELVSMNSLERHDTWSSIYLHPIRIIELYEPGEMCKNRIVKI